MSDIGRFDQLRRSDIEAAGGKGANLGELSRAGFPVPTGFVILTSAYRVFVEANGLTALILRLAESSRLAEPLAAAAVADAIHALFGNGTVPESLRGQILEAYASLAIEDAAVAVRSSATAEDLAEASFAGQQDTFLNVRDQHALIAAVKDCWASLWTARAMTYRARQGIDPRSVSLAVVVQRMVDADAAGVMFTANPGNGRRDQVVISAAWGLGESIVSGSVNTDDIVVGHDGTIVSRRTAEKTVMTVPLAQGTEEQPVAPARRRERVLDDAAAAELAALGVRIADLFGTPQDIEWARGAGRFFVLQSRPITMLPEPAASSPSQWPVLDPKSLYFRASIVEQLPDPLSPLFADLADGSVTRSLHNLMSEFMGGDVVGEHDLGFPTINGYAYYRYSRGAMWRMLRRTPSALTLLVSTNERSGTNRWRQYSHPRYVKIVQTWTSRPVETLEPSELLAGVIELLDAGTEYYTAVQTIIPLAAFSETMFASFYNRVIRRPGDPSAQVFLLGFDSAPIRAEKSLYDLGSWAHTRPDLVSAIQALPSTRLVELLRSGEPPTEVDESVWREWQSRFQTHLDQFGHAVYNLDFINAVPADDPAPLLATLRFYLRGGGIDPHQRQRHSAERREREAAAVITRVGPLRGRVFARLLHWAQTAAPVREDALADVGLAWPQLRRMLLELGRRLVLAGVIKQPEDVFWLRHDELAHQLHVGGPVTDSPTLGQAVEDRKAVWRAQRQVSPPQLLPKGTWLDSIEGLMPAATADQSGDVIKGIGASAGRVTGVARVLAGPQDFGRMQAGDILVASITTPAWTSLFAMAAGVVTDIGGPLSHSSIVAREYGIPAVLGTGVATRRIRDGQRIRVDGDAGTIGLVDTDGDPDPSASIIQPAHGWMQS
ncbi:MAG: rifampicin phosphotransferase [Propionibacteriaceae bacterium]|jgi:pyruvate,water dikinase|nr:rifampicin phosphotransferase [Propionibacteriaceae bacterium]